MKMKNKYYSANEIKNMILTEKKLSRTNNQKGKKYYFDKGYGLAIKM